MAAEDKKKPKIDLKARLGKTNLGTQSVPLPVPGSGSQPPASSTPMPRNQGIAPPPGISPGIPVPPFAQQKQASVPPPPKPTMVQQTIKVEVGEEIIKERAQAKKRLYAVAAGTALLGLIIGYPIGGAASRNERGKVVVESAKGLLSDIKAANEKMKELDTILGEAADKLAKKEYPTDLAGQLGGIVIPFDSTKIDGTRIGGLKGSTLRSLLNYTSSVDDLNKKKESLKNILEAAKPKVEKGWKEEKEPVFGYSVMIKSDQKGILAELVPNKEPFTVGAAWPESFTVLKPERSQQGVKMVDKKANRYVKGELSAGSDIAIPVDPDSTVALSDRAVIQGLSKAFREMRESLQGIEHPTDPVPGLIKEGDALVTEIQKITAGG
ncbi:formin [Polyangium aurulentum]|uniref:formin n=1 Tax=Polyangium aurulentum TaxID=2567896 RepID=UPI0010ADB320|nr:formin [Polyangium aurulentum]UQA54870.1 formin [Polyangium aurulentum]